MGHRAYSWAPTYRQKPRGKIGRRIERSLSHLVLNLTLTNEGGKFSGGKFVFRLG